MVKKQLVPALLPVLTLVLLLAPVIGPAAVAQRGDPPTGEDPERAFLQHMIMHHHMAVLMAQPLVEGGTHDELRALAQDIITTQSAEIAQMRGWLMDWYGMSPPMGPMGPGMPPGPEGMGMPGMMPGMEMPPDMMSGMPMGPDMMPMMAGMEAMMDMMSLAGLSGERLEVAFMLLMVAHHQDAITRAEQVLEQAQREEVRQLAREIIAAQSAEVQQLNAWLAAWYGL